MCSLRNVIAASCSVRSCPSLRAGSTKAGQKPTKRAKNAKSDESEGDNEGEEEEDEVEDRLGASGTGSDKSSEDETEDVDVEDVPAGGLNEVSTTYKAAAMLVGALQLIDTSKKLPYGDWAKLYAMAKPFWMYCHSLQCMSSELVYMNKVHQAPNGAPLQLRASAPFVLACSRRVLGNACWCSVNGQCGTHISGSGAATVPPDQEATSRQRKAILQRAKPAPRTRPQLAHPPSSGPGLYGKSISGVGVGAPCVSSVHWMLAILPLTFQTDLPVFLNTLPCS